MTQSRLVILQQLSATGPATPNAAARGVCCANMGCRASACSASGKVGKSRVGYVCAQQSAWVKGTLSRGELHPTLARTCGGRAARNTLVCALSSVE